MKKRKVLAADMPGGPGYGLAQPSPSQSGSDPYVREDSLPTGAPMAVHEMNRHEPVIHEALLIRPYYLDMAKRVSAKYPTLAKILRQQALAAEEDETFEPEMIETDPAQGEEVEIGEEAPSPEAAKEEGLAKLEIATPEEFAIKYKGKIAELAEEHGIGDPIAYSFRSRKIELIGSEAILLLDYDMNALHTRPMYPVEDGATVEPTDEEEIEEESEEDESEDASEDETE